MTGWDVYWIMRLDGLHSGFCAASTLLTLAFLGLLFLRGMSREDGDKETAECAGRWMRPAFWSAVAFAALALFTPTTKEAAAIYILPRIVNSEIISKDLPTDAAELYKLAVAAVKEKLAPAETTKGGK
jgi:hypothetical protein